MHLFQNTFTFPHLSPLHKAPHILGCLLVGREQLKEEVGTQHNTLELEEENMKNVEADELTHLVKLDLNNVLHGSEEGAIKRKKKCLKRQEGTIKKRKRIGKGGEEDIGLMATQQAIMKSESEKKERKVKVSSLPALVLERVFSYLNWRDLGRVMLVCRRWSNVGGHPSLWTGFPLQLTGPRRLKSFSKIRRLVWIKSVTITPLPGRELENCHAVVKHFGRMEELFVNGGNDGVDIPDVLLVNLLREQVSKNRLVRFGVKMHYGILVAQYAYFVESCDAATNAFVEKTLPSEEDSFVCINGLPRAHLSCKILETICRNKTSPLMIRTNLMIEQNIEVLKLTEILKCHVRLWDIGIIDVKDLEDQDVVPINAILDLLGSANHGEFELLSLPKELLLNSDWAERLGGRSKIEAYEGENGSVQIKHTKSGLKLLSNTNTEEEEGSEDDGEGDEEDDDEDDDEEEEENLGEVCKLCQSGELCLIDL